MPFKSIGWVWKDMLSPVLADSQVPSEDQNRAEHNCVGSTNMAEPTMVSYVAGTDDRAASPSWTY